MNPTVRWLLVGLTLAGLAPAAQPQILAAPAQMNIQGRLTKPDGTAVPDGNYSVRFSLWSASSGGGELWNETVSPVATHSGTFSALVSGFPAGLFNGNLWLEVKVGADPPMTPRQPLSTVPYAFKANSVADGAVGASGLADGAVTASKLAPGALGQGQLSPGTGMGVTGHAVVTGYASGIRAAGPYAYVLGFTDSTFNVVDISNPSLPRVVSSVAASHWPNDLRVSGNLVYVTGNGAVLDIYDVSNPAAPVVVGNLPGSAFTMALDGTYVYTADLSQANPTFNVIDVSNPHSPTVVGHTNQGYGFPYVFVHGNYAYVGVGAETANTPSYISVIDISNKTAPVVVNTVQLPAFCRGLVGNSNFLYAAVGNNSAATAAIVAFDISNPAAPSQVGITPIGGLPNYIDLNGNTLATSSADSFFLQVFDVSNGASPSQTDWVLSPDYSGGAMTLIPGYILLNGVDFRVIALQGARSPASLLATGGVVVDSLNVNDGETINALTFGSASGEGIASKRTPTGNLYGLDFYTGFTPKMQITNSGNVGIGMMPSYTLDVNGTIRGTNVTPSDARFKQHIASIPDALSRVLRLRGVEFDWKPGDTQGHRFPKGRQIGFVAQEAEKVLPEIVSTDGQGYKSVAYQEVVPALVEALKAQQKRIDRLEAEVRTLRHTKRR